MQQATRRTSIPGQDDWAASLPLYLSSLAITLAGVGSVGVTATEAGWTAIWATLAVVGHGVSLALRRLRVPLDVVLWPVMLIGMVVVLQLLLMGSPLVGMTAPLTTMPIDMVTAITVAAFAVVRSFTLVTDGTLLFSTVPGISMLALVGSSNPNAEIPVFFAVLVFGSLFASSYESHLRRVERTGRPALPVAYHLFSAWAILLPIALAAWVAAAILQPVLGQFSPFAWPAMNRFRSIINFTQTGTQQAPVGRGPIRLSPMPVFEVYTDRGGLLRTAVFTRYTGRGWTLENQPLSAELQPTSERFAPVPPQVQSGVTELRLHEYRIPPDPDVNRAVPYTRVEQTVIVRSAWTNDIPAFPQVVELRHPRARVRLHAGGTLSGSGQLRPGQVFQVTSHVREYPPDALRQAGPPDPEPFAEALSLPQSTLQVQSLARQVTRGANNNYDRVRAILAHIEKTCQYTLLEEPTPPGEDAVAFYLFKTRRGACDLSASAAAVMCRAVGIPARAAVGYVAEEPLPDGRGYLIRQEHAHMWLEAYFPGYGWVEFDPAPPLSRIRDHPLMAAYHSLRSMLRKVGGGGLDAVLLIALVLITLVTAGYSARDLWTGRAWKRVRRTGGGPELETARVYERALHALERRGWKREPWQTPREYLGSVRPAWEAAPDAVRSLEVLTELFEGAQYRGIASTESVERARAELRRLSREVPRRKKGPSAPAVGSVR